VNRAGRVQKLISLISLLVLAVCSPSALSQTSPPSERVFSQPKEAVAQALKKLQASMAGRLPALEGFAIGDQSLDRYRRAYFQTTAQVNAGASGSTMVRVSTKITAWYTDPAGTHSGYRLLSSNGRLESDLLDQLSDELAQNTNAAPAATVSAAKKPAEGGTEAPLETSAVSPSTEPQPPKPSEHVAANGKFSTPLTPTLPAREQVIAETKKPGSDLDAEIKSLEDVLHNQGHPNNLVAVKQSGTAVVASPSLTAKTLFLASAHDEFEMLDFNADWVHVRVSGLSRGWIWRNSLEMPDGIPETLTRSGSGPKAAAEHLFHVTREETAQFPGDWQPLKGKSVKILSIEKAEDSQKDSGIIMRLEFAKAQIQKNYEELAQKSGTLAGIVLIFDSADGGMIAATLPSMQQWKAGTLSDSAFWHQCFFDPPELGGTIGASASQ
jgi:hypothetical protein